MPNSKTTKDSTTRLSEAGSGADSFRERLPFYRSRPGGDEPAALDLRVVPEATNLRRGAVQTRHGRLLDRNERTSREVLGDRIKQAIAYVDNYDVELGTPDRSVYVKRPPLLVRGQPVSIDDVFPGEALLHLQAGAHERRDARVAFLTRFANVVLERGIAPPGGGPRRAGAAQISLQDLLGGSANVTLYKRAIEEERDSRAFRAAVVLASVKAFREEIELLDWTSPKHLIIGGPSGAGKTFATKSILRALMRFSSLAHELRASLYVADANAESWSLANARPKPVPFIVGVDGGDARATSQIRKLVLQVALVLGYVGISDLHAKTGSLDIKHQIKAAAFHRASRVHVVEPRTFANIVSESYASVATSPARVIFCLVNTPDDVIRFQGATRAWYDFASKPTKVADDVDLNKVDVGCESKEYNDAYLSHGRTRSRHAHVKYMEDAVNRGHVPVSVLFDNRASLEGDRFVYARPNIAIHYGPFSSQRGVFRKKGEFAEVAHATLSRLQAVAVRAGAGAATARDRTAVAHEEEQRVILAYGFDAHIVAQPEAPMQVAVQSVTADGFMVIEPALALVSLPFGEETVQTKNHGAWERVKRAKLVDENLVHVPVEATGFCFLTALATHVGKSTVALMRDFDRAAERLGPAAQERWLRELRAAGAVGGGAQGIDPFAIEEVLLEAGVCVEIFELDTTEASVVRATIPSSGVLPRPAVRLLLRSAHFDLLLPREEVDALDLPDDGTEYIAKGFRDVRDIDRDPKTMAPRRSPSR